MKEKIRKLACEQGWRPEYLMEALKALAEDAFGAVSVLLELHSCFPLKLAAPVIRQGKCHLEYPYEFINPVALCHVSLLELIAALFQVTEKRLDAPSHLVEFQSFRALVSMADDCHESVAPFASLTDAL
jgi:hypothetical protein